MAGVQEDRAPAGDCLLILADQIVHRLRRCHRWRRLESDTNRLASGVALDNLVVHALPSPAHSRLIAVEHLMQLQHDVGRQRHVVMDS